MCCDWRISIHCWFLYFCGQSVVAVIMIGGSKTCKSLAGVGQVQSPYVIERQINSVKMAKGNKIIIKKLFS